MEYLMVKWLHILSSTVLFGTGIGSAFYLLCASVSRDLRAITFTSRYVVLADWLFTTPTVILQPLTGFYLLHLSHIPVTTAWVLWSVALYMMAIICWLPVVWLQIQMRNLSHHAIAENTVIPDKYWRYFRLWMGLGFPALFAFVAIFYLMVAKPV